RLIARLGQNWTPLEKTAIVKALRAFGDKAAIQPLSKILHSEPGTSAEEKSLRLEALRSLAQLEPKAALPFAEKFLDQSGGLQHEAISILGTQSAGAKLVAERFLAKKLPRDTLSQVTDGLRKHLAKDPELGKLLTEVMKGGLLVSLQPHEVLRIQGL